MSVSFFLSNISVIGFLTARSSMMGAGMLAGRFSLPVGSKLSFFAGESPILRFARPEDACN